MISVVIPVGPGRDANLKLVLYALEKQTYQDFEVVIGTNSTTLDWAQSPRVYVKYIEHKVPNLASINRNEGVKHSRGDHIVFIDSDVVLCKEALSYYAEGWKNYSERVIIGPYHWLPPMIVEEKDIDEWTGFINGELPRAPMYGDHMITRDWRKAWHNSPDLLFSDYSSCLAMLSGNMGISRKMFDYVGGFDEELPRAEDGAFGIAVCAAGFQYSFDGRINAGHLYHARDASTMAIDPIPMIIEKWHRDPSWIGRMTWGQLTKDRQVMA